MITRDLLKQEIDKIQDEYLSLLFEVIRAFELNPNKIRTADSDWRAWVNEMYGYLDGDKIQRYPQGNFEIRETFA